MRNYWDSLKPMYVPQISLKDARLEKKEQIKICGNQPATRFAVD